MTALLFFPSLAHFIIVHLVRLQAFSLVSPWTYIVGYQYDAATDEGTVQYRSFSSSSGEDLILDAAISTEGVIGG